MAVEADEGVESLEDLELYFDILRNAVVHCLDDGQELREGDWAQGDVTGTHVEAVEVFVSVEPQGHGHELIGWSQLARFLTTLSRM
jgi:hypothetical protein